MQKAVAVSFPLPAPSFHLVFLKDDTRQPFKRSEHWKDASIEKKRVFMETVNVNSFFFPFPKFALEHGGSRKRKIGSEQSNGQLARTLNHSLIRPLVHLLRTARARSVPMFSFVCAIHSLRCACSFVRTPAHSLTFELVGKCEVVPSSCNFEPNR